MRRTGACLSSRSQRLSVFQAEHKKGLTEGLISSAWVRLHGPAWETGRFVWRSPPRMEGSHLTSSKHPPRIARAQDQVCTISVRAHGFYGEKELRQAFPVGTSRVEGAFEQLFHSSQRPARDQRMLRPTSRSRRICRKPMPSQPQRKTSS